MADRAMAAARLRRHEPCGHQHGVMPATHRHGHDAKRRGAGRSDRRSSRRAGLASSRDGRDLLMDVDLDIHEREIVTLIGPNGAGKTTLVRVLLGLEKPDRGAVHRRKDLRIGYVPQRFDSRRRRSR